MGEEGDGQGWHRHNHGHRHSMGTGTWTGEPAQAQPACARRSFHCPGSCLLSRFIPVFPFPLSRSIPALPFPSRQGGRFVYRRRPRVAFLGSAPPGPAALPGAFQRLPGSREFPGAVAAPPELSPHKHTVLSHSGLPPGSSPTSFPLGPLWRVTQRLHSSFLTAAKVAGR